MRINRENTLIENNLYPFAGFSREEIIESFVKSCRPYEDHIMQFQAAFLLHNMRLFLALICIVVGLNSFIYMLFSCDISAAIILLIIIPLLELIYCFDVHISIQKLYIEVPKLDAEDPSRLRPLESLVAMFWKPVLVVWRAGFFVYRTIVCPNPIDSVILIVLLLILGVINRIVHLGALLSISSFLFVLFPAVYIKFSSVQKQSHH